MDLSLEESKFAERWWSLLGHHFKADGCIQTIYDKLIDIKSKGYEIYPLSNDVYKQFKIRDFDQVMVVFITKNPIRSYESNPQWKLMSKWIETECYDGLNLNLEDNMEYLYQSGVIHVPLNLTIGQDGEHPFWLPFTKDIIKSLFTNSLNNLLFVVEPEILLNELSDIKGGERHTFIKLEEGCFKIAKEFILKEYNTRIIW